MLKYEGWSESSLKIVAISTIVWLIELELQHFILEHKCS